jgi:peptidoglycan/xylan/chitin deacetylase (PgdA/CDA1 family)
MNPVRLLERVVPAPAYRLARGAGLATLGSVMGADVGEAPLVALTFDDGPGPATPAILDALARAGARATFFLLGRNVRKYPDTARDVARAGHELANHTFSHRALPGLRAGEQRRELEAGRAAIAEVTGAAPRLLRPPFGLQSIGSYLAARRAGYQIVGWSVVGKDWDGDAAETIAARISGPVAPGDIVLLHDAAPDAEAPSSDRKATVAALEMVLAQLAARGLRAVTVSDLLAAGPARRKLWFRRGPTPRAAPAPA